MPESGCGVVRRVPGPDVYIFLLLEFQSTVDTRMPVRFLRYITGVYQNVMPGRR